MTIDTDISSVCKEHFIDFETLESDEEILIETQNSFYKFAVEDATQRRGSLCGGSVGSQGCMAILMGAVKRQGESYVSDPEGLHTNARAFFYIETAQGMKHLITSLITNLSHIKKDEKPELVF